ncbi:hypothetical protein [Microbacterium alcoholitolerans]|uniref:hypothetical protein n=1 Tax=unclassified Microbacterium TaxID=2609290 RepID=UPI003D16577D
MATPSSIERHEQSARIIELISQGVSGAEIARRYGVSESAISRYKISRQNLLAQIAEDDGNDPSEVIGRLADLSDSARTTRKLADATSSPAVRARAISAELAVLDRLTKLAIDDTATARLAQTTGPLVRVIQKLSQSYPREVFEALAKHEELADLLEALRAQKRKTR